MSLNAMDSNWVSVIMRFTGYIGGHSIQMLLDGASDDNFMQPQLAIFLQLSILPTQPFKVLVGDGSALTIERLVNCLSWDHTLLIIGI